MMITKRWSECSKTERIVMVGCVIFVVVSFILDLMFRKSVSEWMARNIVFVNVTISMVYSMALFYLGWVGGFVYNEKKQYCKEHNLKMSFLKLCWISPKELKRLGYLDLHSNSNGELKEPENVKKKVGLFHVGHQWRDK